MVGSIAAVIALVVAGLGLSAWSIRMRGRRAGRAPAEGNGGPGVGASATGEVGDSFLTKFFGHSEAAHAGAGTVGSAHLGQAGGHGDPPDGGGTDEGATS